jgi:hypothetical protein
MKDFSFDLLAILNQTHYRELHDVKDSVKKTFESAEDEEEE